jgi:hypothetical protein
LNDEIYDKIDTHENMIKIRKNTEDLLHFQKLKNINYKLSTKIFDRMDDSYNSIITSKINLMSESMDYINTYKTEWSGKHLLWLDAGISHVMQISKLKFIKHTNMHISDKITLVTLCPTDKSEVQDKKTFLHINRYRLAGGYILVPWKQIKWFSSELEKQFDYSIYELKQYCFEEQLIPIIAAENPQLVNYIFSDYWLLPNLNKIRFKINTVVMALTHCRTNGFNPMGVTILKQIMRSVAYGKCYIDKPMTSKWLYDGQIVSYYADNNLSKQLSLIIHYLYHNVLEFKTLFNNMNTSNNIKFFGIDLDNPTSGDPNFLNSDLAKYIQIVL